MARVGGYNCALLRLAGAMAGVAASRVACVVRSHQLDLRLRLPSKRLPISDHLERIDDVGLRAHTQDLTEGAPTQMAQDLEASARRRGDLVGDGANQVAQLVVRATAPSHSACTRHRSSDKQCMRRGCACMVRSDRRAAGL